MSRIKLSDFSGTDDRARFAAALDYMKEHSGTTLFVEPGEYTITSKRARDAQQSVMNGDFGANPEPVMFNPKYEYDRGLDFAGHCGSRVEAYGVTLMIDGFMEPISVRDCRDVEICGLTVDHVRKPYTKGIITSYRQDGDAGYISVELCAPITPRTPYPRSVVYNFTTGRFDIPAWIGEMTLSDPCHAEFRCDAKMESSVGNELYLWHTFHSRPVVLIENAENTVLRDLTVHSAPGMGITAQQAKDILIERLRIIPSVGEHMSTNTDATHFASCRGKLRLDGCEFDGQGDDSINVHTYYYTADEYDGAKARLSIKAPTGTHAQALDYPLAGDTLELTEKATLNPVGKYRVLSVTPDFEKYCCHVELDRELPDDMEGYFLADCDELPELEFVNCRARNHFARSILIKCRRALVENCEVSDVFDSAVKIAAEAGWHEGISSADVTVRRCRFINCARWSKLCGGIQVFMDCSDRTALSHGLVTIEDNIIDCPEAEHAIIVENTRQARLARNKTNSRGDGTVIGEGVELI